MFNLNCGNGGEPIPQPMSREEAKRLFDELFKKLDRVGELLLETRAKHEAEAARRAAVPYFESWHKQLADEGARQQDPWRYRWPDVVPCASMNG